MALFSGLQIFGILCSIVKMKLVALWLQAEGIGMFGIFNSTIDTTATLTDLGLRQSAVRDVAQQHNSATRLSRIVAVVRRWSYVGGAFGAVILSALSMPLSVWFFNDSTHWWQFCIIGGCMILNSIVNGEQAIMQGSGMLSSLARSSLIASVAGLVISIPMFYFWGENSVVASIVAYALTGAAAAIMCGWKGNMTKVSAAETFNEGKSFVKLGIYMSAAAFVANLAHLAFLAWLSNESDTSEVGRYQAGVTLVVRYVGLIFTAIGMEFYPRLAANIFSSRRVSLFVNHEIKLILLIITPVALIFLILRKWIVILLYSSQFEVIIPFISWAILSCVFKGVSWCMAYVMLAKGDGKTYIFTETVDSIIGLTLCIAGYEFYGLAGVGMAYVGWYMAYTLLTAGVYMVKYKLAINKSTIHTGVSALFITGGAFALLQYYGGPITVIILLFVACGFILPIRRLWAHR